MLAWAAWQLQFSPMVCETSRKHVTKPFPQPAPQTTSLSLIDWFILFKEREGREKEARRQKVAKRLPKEPKEGADKVARLR